MNIDILYIVQNIFLYIIEVTFNGKNLKFYLLQILGTKKLLIKIIDQDINISVDICSLLINQSSVGTAPLG